MGAVVAILGEAGDSELTDGLQRMLSRSPHRGDPELLIEGPLAIGSQSLNSDASLAEHGNWIVAFHGFVGNWGEMASERSWRFKEESTDAVKIAVGFEDLGAQLFSRLRGEWAVLIWDRQEQTLVAARDIAGCRSLYSHRHGDRTYLATEIRQVLAGSGAEARCNPGTAADFILLRFPERGKTFFRGVDIFPGGIARIYHRKGSDAKVEEAAFWKPPRVRQGQPTEQELIEELRWLLDRAVTRATPSTGATLSLSGGMDSSSVWGTLACLANTEDLQSGKFQTISNVYPGLPCDETPYIVSIHSFTGADGTLIDTAKVLASDYLNQLCGRFDQPHLPNALPLELVCETASANGHTTLFTGVGGDEWLGGSLQYVRELFYAGNVVKAIGDLLRVRLPKGEAGLRNKMAWLTPGLGISRRFGLRVRSPERMRGVVNPAYVDGVSVVPGSWRQRVKGEDLVGSKKELVSCLDRLVAGSVLEIVEAQGAWHGLDIRHPLMDVDVMNFGFSVESRAMIAGRCHKWLLRRAMADRLPKEVTRRIETTVFTDLFTREKELLQEFPPGREWELANLGIALADGIDRRQTAPYSVSDTYELVLLWWLESFLKQHFSSSGAAGPAEEV
jgi:asparagine synthase (glutamine-hydrolysing)